MEARRAEEPGVLLDGAFGRYFRCEASFSFLFSHMRALRGSDQLTPCQKRTKKPSDPDRQQE